MITVTALLAQAGPYGNHMGGWDDGTSWWMVAMMSIFGVAVIAAIIWGAIAISRTGHTNAAAPPATPPTGPSPRDILDRRYANGEIDTADYEERRAKLQ